MPFGLRNAPPTFQRAMTVALEGTESFASVYIDDILVYSPDRATYLVHLSRVFERLQAPLLPRMPPEMRIPQGRNGIPWPLSHHRWNFHRSG